MLLTAIVILLLLASAAAFALVTVARVRRAYNKRRLLFRHLSGGSVLALVLPVRRMH